jgi:glycine/D-amino acid oxidase-like deaminating enzyme
LGEPVDLIDRDCMKDLTGTGAFHGGLWDHRAGTINPMGYCRGLARAATAAGARIVTGARVTALQRDATGWRVSSERGTVFGTNVVLGTNAYTDSLWPGLKGVFSTIHYLQFATEPLGREAAHILPGRQGLWDTGTIMFSLRRDAFDRLIIGTMGRVIGTAETGLTRRWAERRLGRLFPELRGIGFESAWHGQIAMTPDHLPRVHQLDKGLWTAIGYNGRGITTGTVFGQAMADLLTGTDPADLPLPVSDMQNIPRAGLTSRFYDMAFTANQALRAVI